jgi:hypothetical protein
MIEDAGVVDNVAAVGFDSERDCLGAADERLHQMRADLG